jgi:hypothetical protein
MSQVLFFSSPLRPSNSYQANPNPFSTPQVKTWDSYAPPTPSPLRTSRNVNVMPQRRQPDNNDEENMIPKTPAENLSPQLFFLNSTPVTSENQQSSRAAQFQYQSRARATAPSVQLQNHAASKRDSRKKLFLDRLRNKRDDERCERTGDQVMRMDYIKERKAWEEEMQKRGMDDLDEIEEDSEMQEQTEELSPTEDKEIEELVSYLNDNEEEDDFSDEEYDALFMEVMSQESLHPSNILSGSRIKQCSTDTDMDMS